MPLADTQAIAFMLGVPAHTIRNWAARGKLQPARTEGTRTLYDVEAAVKVAAGSGHLPDLRAEDDGYCCSPGCKAVTWPDMEVPLCAQHALAVWLRVNDEWQKRLPAPVAPTPPARPLVYFARSGDLVKIGTTTCLPARLDALATHGPAKPQLLLAVAGGRAEEKQVHALFREERVRGEWFRPSERLLAFIADRVDQDVRAVHGRVVAQ